MNYRHTLLAVACLVLPVGLLLVLDPARVSDSVGLAQHPELARACSRYEDAKQELVRVNGGHVLGFGLFALFLRPMTDPRSRRLGMGGMLAVASLGLLISIHGLVDRNTTGLIWAPVALQTLLVSVLALGMHGLRRRRPPRPRPGDLDAQP